MSFFKLRVKRHKTLLLLFGVFVLLSALFVAIYHDYFISRADIAPATISQNTIPIPGRFIVKFRPEVTKDKANKVMKDYNVNVKADISQIGYKVIELPAEADDNAFLNAFKNRREIEMIEQDQKLPLLMIPDDPLYTNQWHLPKIEAPTAWELTTGSAKIAILDSGTNINHPDLAPNALPGRNFYDNNSDTTDVLSHGTYTAGIAAAKINNSLGVASVCGDCKFIPIRVSDSSGYLTWSAIINGLVWAADQGARVANLSAAASNSGILDSAADYFRSKGGVVIVGAGNTGQLNPNPDDPHVITVGATKSDDTRWSSSTWGNNLDVVAPGDGIYTTTRGGGYAAVIGTSYSTAVVSGVAGLIVSANPNLTSGQIESILESTANDLGTAGWDQNFGWGRVNAARAVEAAKSPSIAQDTTAPTLVFTSPPKDTTVSGKITAKIDVKDNIGISSATLNMDGINEYTPSSVQTISENNLIYSFLIDTTLSKNGWHTLNAAATDIDGNLSATISIRIYINNVSDSVTPVVSITSPANGSKVKGTKVIISTTATDSIGVVRVEFYIDNVLKGADTSSPYSYSWNIRKLTAGSHTITVKAYDAAGNVGTATATVTK